MMADWVQRQLRCSGYESKSLGGGVLEVYAPGGDFRIFCPEANERRPLSTDELMSSLNGRSVEFILLVKREAGPDVYEWAHEGGVGIDSLRALQDGLDRGVGALDFKNKERLYLEKRLLSCREISSIRRLAACTYQISRHGNRDLTGVFIHPYELTADEILTVWENNREFELDAVVTTNPYARSFSEQARVAANRMGIKALTLRSFLEQMGDEWL